MHGASQAPVPGLFLWLESTLSSPFSSSLAPSICRPCSNLLPQNPFLLCSPTLSVHSPSFVSCCIFSSQDVVHTLFCVCILVTHVLLGSWGSFIFIRFLLWLWWALNWLPLKIQLVKVSLLLLRFLSFKVKVKVKLLSAVRLFETPWTVAYQASPSVEFSRQEYRSGLLFPSPGIFLTQG